MMTCKGHSHQNLSTRSGPVTNNMNSHGRMRPIAKSFVYRTLDEVDDTLPTKAAKSLFLTKNSATPRTTKATCTTRNFKTVDCSKMPSGLNRTATDGLKTKPETTIEVASHLSLWLQLERET